MIINYKKIIIITVISFLRYYILLNLDVPGCQPWFKTALQLSKTRVLRHTLMSQVSSRPQVNSIQLYHLKFHYYYTFWKKKTTNAILISSFLSLIIAQSISSTKAENRLTYLPCHEESSQHILGNCHSKRHHYTFSSILQFLQYKWL